MRRLFTLICLIFIMAACDNITRTTPPARITVAPTPEPATFVPQEVGDAAVPTPIATPTTPRIQDCPSSPVSRLIVQERGKVTEDDETLNLRRNPGTSSEVVRRIEPGAVFTVLDGPTCAGEYTWFRIRYKDVEDDLFFEGWIAEGDFEQYYVEPYLPG